MKISIQARMSMILNVLTGGHWMVTFSARSYWDMLWDRWPGRRFWARMVLFIDWLFWVIYREHEHCWNEYLRWIIHEGRPASKNRNAGATGCNLTEPEA